MAFLVATTSLPAVYHPNGYARTTNTGTPHAHAKMTGTRQTNVKQRLRNKHKETVIMETCNIVISIFKF